MVGIPGKSKGCHTCRRRKLGCDLTKPSCWKCTNSGRICEGYERGAVFLNRTEKGLQKRRRLDEARLRGIGRVAQSASVENDEEKKLPKSKSSILHVQSFQILQSPSAMKQRCQGVFMDRFLPSDLGKAGNIGLWLREAVSLDESVQGKALEMSLRALFVTRVGRVMQNQDLIIEGKMAYSGALQELQKALWSKELVLKDETLATCHALAIYELYESTTNSIRGHDNHILGILHLVQHRGSKMVHSRLGDALMRETCYPSMIYSIQYRRASPMKDFILQSESWSQHDISRQRLHSIGLSLGVVIEDIDRFRSAMSNFGVLCEILGRCSKLDDELERWYDGFQKISSLPVYWKSSADFNDPASTEVEFPSLAVAHQMLDFWALQLCIGTLIALLCHGDLFESHRHNLTGIAMSVNIPNLKKRHCKSRFLELATNILESMQYPMREEHGIISAQRCIFPGRVALATLERLDSKKFESCQVIFEHLTQQKGLQFAGHVAKVSGRWEGY